MPSKVLSFDGHCNVFPKRRHVSLYAFHSHVKQISTTIPQVLILAKDNITDVITDNNLMREDEREEILVQNVATESAVSLTTGEESATENVKNSDGNVSDA